MPVPAPPTIPTLPTAPARGVADPVTYVDLADGWAAAQQPWSVKVGETGTWMQARANEVQANADTVATNTETVEEDAAQVAADKATTVAAKNTAVQAKTDILNLYGSAAALDAAVTSASGSASTAAAQVGLAVDQVALATVQAQNAARAVVNNFPDRLDSTGAWFTESSTGDPGSVANASAAAIVNVAGYGYEYLKANAQGQLFAKGVLSASSGKYYEVEAEVEWTVKGASETPAFTVGVQGLDGSYANAGGQVQATLQAVAATGVQTFKYRFGYAAPTGGAAWPSPGVSVWLRPYVLFNRKSDGSGPAAASTARVRRLTVRDVTGAVLGEIQAALAAASAASVSLADQAAAESGVGVGLMSATRVGQAIAAQALGVGAILQSAADPGARFLRTNGSLYLNASYPALRAVLGPYQNPMAVRLSASGNTPRLYYLNGLWIAFIYNGSAWTLYSSPDLLNWTQKTAPQATSHGQGLAYGAGLYVWVSSTAIRTSPDLVNWTTRANPSGWQNFNALTRGATKFVATGTKSGGAPSVAYSGDGINWSATDSTMNNAVYAAAYNTAGARWIAVGDVGRVYRSTDDAVTWADMGTPISGTAVFAAAGGGNFVVCNSSGGAWISPDGQTWTGASAAYTSAVSGLQASCISYDGAAFVISHYSSQLIARSADLVNWTFQTAAGVTGDIQAVYRPGNSVNDPYVIAAPAGVLSGLDLSTTQFQVPTIAADASNTLCYIKAA